MQDPILKVGQVAQALAMSPRTVSKLIDSGELPGYKLPDSHHRRVLLSDVEAFVAKHQLPPQFAAEARQIAGAAPTPCRRCACELR